MIGVFSCAFLDTYHIEKMRTIILSAAIFLLACNISFAADEGYGPFDYTNPQHFHDKLPVVEKYHWNSDVAGLRRGVRGAFPMSDISYILRVFPNHHPALDAMGRLWRRHMDLGEIPMNAQPDQPPEYWFNRAATFAPQDPIPRLLFGIHLQKSGRENAALEQLEIAEALAPDSAEVHYALGLAYFDLEKFDKSSIHAERAYALGYPLPGLRDKLLAAGVWN